MSFLGRVAGLKVDNLAFSTFKKKYAILTIDLNCIMHQYLSHFHIFQGIFEIWDSQFYCLEAQIFQVGTDMEFN